MGGRATMAAVAGGVSWCCYLTIGGRRRGSPPAVYLVSHLLVARAQCNAVSLIV